jgi:CBS-domain-containing membrane protein
VLAKDLMQRNVVTVSKDATLAEAATLMLEHGINSLPVLDEHGRVVGMVGIRDVLRAPLPSGSTMPLLRWTRLEDKVRQLASTRVAQVMARKVVSVSEDASLIELASVMAERGLHPIPVLREGHLLGVVGRADIVRALLQLVASNAAAATASGGG